MQTRRGIFLSMKCLKYFGVLPWSYDKRRAKLVCTSSDLWTTNVAFSLINLISAYSLFRGITLLHWDFIDEFNETISVYSRINLLVAAACQTGIAASCWTGRTHSLRIIQDIIELDHKHLYFERNLRADITFKIFFVWLVITLFGMANILMTMRIAVFKCSLIHLFICWLHGVHLVVNSLIMMFHICLTHVTHRILRSINFKIEIAVSLRSAYIGTELKLLFRERLSLITLCSRISEVHGKCILFIVWQTLSVSACIPLAFVSYFDGKERRHIGGIEPVLITAFLWFSPMLVSTFAVFNGEIIVKELVISAISQLIITFWMTVNRQRNSELIRKVLTIYKQVSLEDSSYLLLIFMMTGSGVAVITFSTAYYIHLLGQSSLEVLITESVYIFQFCTSSLLMSFYICLVYVIQGILKSINENLIKATDLRSIHKLCRTRSEILVSCECEISEIYGPTLVFVSLFFSLSIKYATNAFVEQMIESRIDKNMLLIGAVVAQACVLLYFLFYRDEIYHEANKTARILSRISRRGTSIEKMVDKFLMKNMHQKPILTAYGFFPLNKRTLFKIFAAIFTYMVILVQFKGMENTNKQIASSKQTPVA